MLGGVLLALTFPNPSLVILLPVALVPLMVAVDGATVRRSAWIGFVFGAAFWTASIHWIAYVVHRYGQMPWPVAGVALALTAIILAVPFGAMSAAVAAARPATPLATLGVWTAAWVAQEGLRTYFMNGFPWALLAYPLADTPELMQTASLGGVELTTALVVLVNASLFLAITHHDILWRVAFVHIAAAVFGASALYGQRHLRTFHGGLDGRALYVGVVQTNVSQDQRWTSATGTQVLDDLVDQTRRLAALSKPRPQIILWPESASPFSWSWSPDYRLRVIRLCAELDVAILLSTAWTDSPEDDDAPYYNAALLVTKDGPTLPPYYKLRLVPFGEYVPFRSLLGKIKPISRAVPGSFTPGTEVRLLPFRGRRLGGAVCYEVTYPWIPRDEVRAGADMLFSLTNDSWFGTAGARRQHWQSVVFRSVETGRTMVRAAITGISGLVLETGHALPIVGPDKRGAFVTPVPYPLRTPLAVEAGDTVLFVCAGGIVAAILVRRARARANSPAPKRAST